MSTVFMRIPRILSLTLLAGVLSVGSWQLLCAQNTPRITDTYTISGGALRGEFRYTSGGVGKVVLKKGKSYWD